MKMQSETMKSVFGRGFTLPSFGSALLIKLALWFAVSLAVSLIFFRDFWANLGMMLSPDWIFGQYHAAPWGVLALCLVFLILKRKVVYQEMNRPVNLILVAGGLAVVAGAILIPFSIDYLMFQVPACPAILSQIRERNRLAL